MNIPFVDFSEQYQTVKDEVEIGLKSIFEKGNFILGEEEKVFEEQFARFCGTKHAIGVNSGTDALYLALSALDVSAGDEVILPTFTFIATALAVSYTGATPVFVDIEEDTYNLDPSLLESLITPKTKAILPVHLYGQPANMDEITAVAKSNGLAVVEDAAQAHGALYKERRVGSLGDAACFSFYPTKSLGAFGDGGMVVTDDDAVFKKIMMLRDYGRTDRYNHKIKGFNSRLDTVQAVILSEKLKHLDEWNSLRRDHARQYEKLLAGVSGIQTPVTKNDRTHVFQTYAVRLKNRDAIEAALKERGVGVLIHYPIPVHLQEAYAELGHKTGDFPVSEAVAGEVLSLPMFPHMTGEQIQTVCSHLKELLGA